MNNGHYGNRMCRKAPLIILSIAAAIVFPSFCMALSLVLPTNVGTYTTDVVSYKESRFQSILRQQYDYSCGSAAVASLLTFHYEDPRTEGQVFREMWSLGNQELIRKQGFSLLDMKRYLESYGYQADGFRLSLDRIQKIGVPAITLINNNGYMHFVVIKGISKDQILLGDPVLGVRVLQREEFETIWQGGIVFLIKNQANIARASFNRNAEWKTVAAAPLEFGKSLNARSLADFNLLLPARSDF